MPIQKVVTLYKFEELDNTQKEKARNWWREMVFTDSHDWDGVYEDAAHCAEVMGINIRTRTITTFGGKKLLNQTSIYFSGFGSQGDGACFEGSYEYKEQASHNIRQHAPKEEELHRIADELQELQSRNSYCLRATMKHHGNYYHQYSMNVEVELMENDEKVDQPSKEDSDNLFRLMQKFANWIYRRLQAEYEYQISEECVDENIIANEYAFLRDGTRED